MATQTQQSDPASSLWAAATDSEPTYHQPQPAAHLVVQDGNFCFSPNSGSPFGSPDVHLQKSWMDDDGWTPAEFPDWGSRAGVMGGVVERVKEERRMGAQERLQSPFELDSLFRCSPVQEKRTFAWSPDISLCLSPPAEVTPRGRSNSGGATVSASYGSKFWMGQERKRRGGDTATMFDQGTDSGEFACSFQQHFNDRRNAQH